MRMRAVVFAAEGELTVAERPEPVPGPREVVIETAAVGICGTDTHVLDGEFEGTARYSPFRVYRDEVSVVGTMAVLNSFGRAVAMFEAGAIEARPMISHSFTLEDYGQALRMFRAGQGRKLQVRPNQDTSQTLLGQARLRPGDTAV